MVELTGGGERRFGCMRGGKLLLVEADAGPVEGGGALRSEVVMMQHSLFFTAFFIPKDALSTRNQARQGAFGLLDKCM